MAAVKTWLSLVILCAVATATRADDGLYGAALTPYAPPPSPSREQWPRERLVKFMRELADFVYANHVCRDSSRAVYGMVYEFWKDGQPMQVFGLDAMHDGAWFMGAMATAHRIDPEGRYLQRIQAYQVPFYVNVIRNSDRLFAGGMRKVAQRSVESEKITEPVKGWVPRGWDDGLGIDKVSGKRFFEEFAHAKHAETTIVRKDGQFLYTYFTPSNHLAQDLADSLLNVWLTTRDPAVAQAIMHVQDYRKKYFGSIGPIEFAAGLANGDAKLYQKHSVFGGFKPAVMNPCYTGLYEQKGHALPSYDDGLAWDYRRATGLHLASGEFPMQFAQIGLARVLSHAMSMELYHDDRPYSHGLYFFDLQTSPKFVEGTGRLDLYVSNARKHFGARGVEIAWVGAGLLPILKQNPGLWESYYRANHASEPLVRIEDQAPETDGRPDAIYDKLQSIGDESTRLSLLSDPKNLHLLVESNQAQVNIAIRHAGPVVGQGRQAVFIIKRDGEISATNDGNEPLLFAHGFTAGGRWTAELRIPYTVVPGQVHWINGVEHGRYAVTINDGKPRVVYMLSEPERIRRRLEAMALGTIQTWHDVWQKLHIIPSGYRGPQMDAASWELSDAGNYAHLIQHIALWLMYEEGTSEWELIKKQSPPHPLPAEALPESVLRAQGWQ